MVRVWISTVCSFKMSLERIIVAVVRYHWLAALSSIISLLRVPRSRVDLLLAQACRKVVDSFTFLLILISLIWRGLEKYFLI